MDFDTDYSSEGLDKFAEAHNTALDALYTMNMV